MNNRDIAIRLRERVWDASIPLEIRLNKADSSSYDSEAYLIQVPRLSYLAFLLPNLHSFFYRDLIFPEVSWADGWLEYDDVPLKWHYPLGLLYDLYSGAEPVFSHETSTSVEETETQPWKLTVHFSKYPEHQLVKLDTEEKHLRDLFTNNVKEADFLRNGTGKTMMSLSKDDSDSLWEGVRKHDLKLFHSINTKLLNPQGIPLRNIPVRLYLPHAANPILGQPIIESSTGNPTGSKDEKEVAPGSLRVVQGLIPVVPSSRQRQTIGTALNNILPGLFPNTRLPLVAEPVLHGATLPLDSGVEDLTRSTAYSDGWLHIAFVMF